MGPPGATSALPLFPRSEAAAARVGFGPLRHVVTTGSTNVDLAEEARAGERAAAVLVADHQTAGRGRLDRTWEDDPGRALLVSFRLPAAGLDASAAVACVTAAARAALDHLVSADVRVKWPNDLIVTDAAAPGKLAGVLAELVAGEPTVVVVGIGINVGAIERQEGATSIEELGGPADRDGILAALLEELSARLDDPASVLGEIRRFSATLGADVRAEMPGGVVVEGHAVRLDDRGHLVIRDTTGRETTVTAGDVIHLRRT